jgi:hypothetical protein
MLCNCGVALWLARALFAGDKRFTGYSRQMEFYHEPFGMRITSPGFGAAASATF